MKDKKQKDGICEPHKYNSGDTLERTVFWSQDAQMWACKNCINDVVLMAMARCNKQAEERLRNGK